MATSGDPAGAILIADGDGSARDELAAGFQRVGFPTPRAAVISQKTVGSHIERILGKLGVRSRTQAGALAFREDLVPV